MRIDTNKFSRLVVYGDGKILFEKSRDLTRYGTFENGKFNYDYYDKIEFFNLSEVKNAMKENLNRKDCYFLTYTDPALTWERKKALYIHVSLIGFENLGEVVDGAFNGQINYMTYYKIRFPEGFQVEKTNFEYLNVPKDWKLPEGATWDQGPNCYCLAHADQVENSKRLAEFAGCAFKPYNLIHTWITTEIKNEVVYPADVYSRIEKDAGREERERIASVINEALGRNTVSHYDVEKLLKKLKIEIK